jgi:3-methyladenine DNA glycosylase AlkD
VIGPSDNQFGVRLGAIRKLATKIKTNHALAIALWETGNIDTRLLAILLINPKNLSGDELDRMAPSVGFVQVADWLNSYVVKKYPDKETLRQEGDVYAKMLLQAGHQFHQRQRVKQTRFH